MNKNLTTCKSCGKEMATKAKTCMNCGAKNSKPIYKRVWFILLCAFIFVFAISSIGGKDSPNEGAQGGGVSSEVKDPIVYEEVSVDALMELLDTNALKAEDAYNDKYVKITGRLSVIDSSGDYITLLPVHDEWAFMGVTCYIANDEQLAKVMEMETDDRVVLSGQITSVGEFFAYDLDIHTIE